MGLWRLHSGRGPQTPTHPDRAHTTQPFNESAHGWMPVRRGSARGAKASAQTLERIAEVQLGLEGTRVDNARMLCTRNHRAATPVRAS